MRVSVDRVSDLLDYNTETGDLRWKQRAGRYGRIPEGAIAGWVTSQNYRLVRVDGKVHPASHLAWVISHGKWPDHQIDHVNVDPSDNRLENLREATTSENKRNCHLYANNTSGFKCVYRDHARNKWRAKVVINGKRRWLSRHDAPEDAYDEFVAVSAKEYGEFARPERS